jgi:tetratricopeptide (TPR) repeat protein
MRLYTLTAFLLALYIPSVEAQTNFTRGETLFMNGKPQEAAPFLEKAVSEDASNVKAFIYLGMIYEQLGQTEEAIAAYLKILPHAADETACIAYNLGNVYYRMGNVPQAEQYYTRAIEADASFSSAYLNRANSRLYTDRFDEAFADYDYYLALEPRSAKREQIEQIRALALAERAAAAEQQRVQEEEARREAEQAALAEEERRQAAEELARAEAAAEEERRQAAEELARAKEAWRQLFFEGVVASLQEQAASLITLSVGAETVQWEAGTFELE